MRRALVSIALLSAVAVGPVVMQTAVAQTADPATKLRVDKLEKEMKAVQRKVFPNGAPIDPELGPIAGTQSGVPSAGPVADLTNRVDALENQLKTLTGQIEQNTNRIRKLEDAVKAMKTAEPSPMGTNAPDPELPAPKPMAATPTPPVAAPKPTVTPIASTRPAISAPSAPSTKPAVATKIDPKRKAAVAAVEIPDTGDVVEDAYTYGFRLWTAKLYPEAQVKLKEFSAKNTKHRRASYAQNLLGRAYLDEGKPALASVAFYENYTKNPKGERAPESLYFLGVALTKLNKLPDACKVYDEFGDVYGAKATADLKAKVAQGRTNAKCSA
jgi:TolA-binding protein